MSLFRRSVNSVRGAFGLRADRTLRQPRVQFKNGEFSLTAQQVAQLIAAASSRDALLIRVLAETGIRRSELINLCWVDLNAERRLLMVRRGKGGKMRLIPITRRLLVALLHVQSSRDSTAFIFASRQSQKLSTRQVNRIVASVGRRAAVQHPNPRYRDITPHLFRHTFARLWKARGGSMESLSKLLGHQSWWLTASVYGTEGLVDVQRNYDATIRRMYTPPSGGKTK